MFDQLSSDAPYLAVVLVVAGTFFLWMAKYFKKKLETGAFNFHLESTSCTELQKIIDEKSKEILRLSLELAEAKGVAKNSAERECRALTERDHFASQLAELLKRI